MMVKHKKITIEKKKKQFITQVSKRYQSSVSFAAKESTSYLEAHLLAARNLWKEDWRLVSWPATAARSREMSFLQSGQWTRWPRRSPCLL